MGKSDARKIILKEAKVALGEDEYYSKVAFQDSPKNPKQTGHPCLSVLEGMVLLRQVMSYKCTTTKSVGGMTMEEIMKQDEQISYGTLESGMIDTPQRPSRPDPNSSYRSDRHAKNEAVNERNGNTWAAVTRSFVKAICREFARLEAIPISHNGTTTDSPSSSSSACSGRDSGADTPARAARCSPC